MEILGMRVICIMAKKKVKALVCIGDDDSNLKKAFQRDIKDLYAAPNLEAAVKMASLLAQNDDVVLFSPACKSDDSTETYIERGKLFTETVMQLKK